MDFLLTLPLKNSFWVGINTLQVSSIKLFLREILSPKFWCLIPCWGKTSLSSNSWVTKSDFMVSKCGSPSPHLVFFKMLILLTLWNWTWNILPMHGFSIFFCSKSLELWIHCGLTHFSPLKIHNCFSWFFDLLKPFSLILEFPRYFQFPQNSIYVLLGSVFFLIFI